VRVGIHKHIIPKRDQYTKIFTLENFPLYGTLHFLLWNESCRESGILRIFQYIVAKAI